MLAVLSKCSCEVWVLLCSGVGRALSPFRFCFVIMSALVWASCCPSFASVSAVRSKCVINSGGTGCDRCSSSLLVSPLFNLTDLSLACCAGV